MASKIGSPFIISFGAEPYFLDADLERARTWKDRSIVLVDGADISDVELVGICETRQMDDSLRVIIVDEANKVKGDKALKAYIDDKNPKDDSTVLVAILRTDKCPEVWLRAAKKGKLIEHKKLKTWDSNNEVVRWIEGEARRLGLTLGAGIADALFALLGSNLYRIISELQKLQLLVGKETVTTQHIRLVISPVLIATPFQVADAAVNKNLKSAMNLLSVLYKNMGEEANVPITSALMWQVEKLTVVRSLLDQGMSEEDIAGAIGMHLYRFKNSLLPMARKHKLRDLLSMMSRLCTLDENVKGSARSKRTHVELAVLSIAG